MTGAHGGLDGTTTRRGLGWWNGTGLQTEAKALGFFELYIPMYFLRIQIS